MYVNTLNSQKDSSRDGFIDVLKGLAMIAVIIDHLSGYGGITNKFILFSIYSVTLFILVSGYNMYHSYERKGVASFFNTMKKLDKLIVFYIIATITTLLYSFHKIDLITLLDYLIKFKGSGAYYFIVVFIQLVLISGILYKIIKLYDTFFFDIFILVMSYIISMIFIKYTFILQVHGGGQFLFGGTYFFTFVIGYMIAKWNKLIFTKASVITTIALLILSLIWLSLYFLKSLRLNWLNPPDLTIICYSLSIFFCVYFINLLYGKLNRGGKNNRFIKYGIQIISLPITYLKTVGKYSIHIFLWQHLFIYSILPQFMQKNNFSSITFAFVVTVIGIFLGVVTEYSLKMFKTLLNKQ